MKGDRAMECTHCGSIITGSDTKCGSCGYSVADESMVEDQELNRLLAEANLMRIRKRLDEAVALCTRVLRLDPANATAHSLMGDIYQDKSNYREALGWYKLAVQLDPTNSQDAKKLDSTIGRVFEGEKKGRIGKVKTNINADEGEQVEIIDLTDPLEPAVESRNTILLKIRLLLQKITPAHVIISSIVIAMVVVIIILLADNSQRQPAKVTRVTAKNSQSKIENQKVPNIVPVTRPNSDGAIPGLGVKIVPKDDNKATNNSVDSPPTGNNSSNNEETATSVPPFPLNGKHNMTGAQLKKITDDLNSALLAALKNAQLSSIVLRNIEIDPRTMVLSLEYEIPPMKTDTETKQALLYAAFYLVWEAQGTNRDLRAFNVSGYAHPAGAPKDPLSKALLADIVPQQANDARAVGSYKEVVKYLSNSWWRDDLIDAEV